MIFIKIFFSFFYPVIIFIIIFSSIYLFLFQSFSSNSNNTINPDASNFDYYFSTSNFFWPLPGYHRISSYFGPRNSPTQGASSNHSGIDIPAPEGTSIYSIIPGTVTFTGFKGAGGHTITLENNNIQVSYCHVSPNYIVTIGNSITSGEIIGTVGPKYISQGNSSYKDSSGRFTNGATTGCHLHLTIKKDGIAVNPLLFFE